MSGLISYSELQQSAPLPVAIDYPAALALRQMALIQGKLPKYLLAPEVSALHHYVPDLHRRMLLATLWNTYICINEALALTLSDFSLVPPYPFVQLATLKGVRGPTVRKRTVRGKLSSEKSISRQESPLSANFRLKRHRFDGVFQCTLCFDISDSYFTNVRFRSIGLQTPYLIDR